MAQKDQINDRAESPSEHKLRLAGELLDDIELGRLTTENLLLKVARLARLVKDDDIRAWIHYELVGFVSDDPISIEFMGLTGRWTDQEKGLGYWQSLAEIEALSASYKVQMQQLEVPDIHFAPSSTNPHEFVTGWGGSYLTQATAPVGQVLQQLSSLTTSISNFTGVRSRVMNLLHAFVSRTYYELLFSNVQESIFERHKAVIDARIASSCGVVLEKVPAIYDRLATADNEAISQALSTCRRIIDAFADSIFPPREGAITMEGAEVKLTAQHHQNRINAFIVQHCMSSSRRKSLRRALQDLYERVSTGVHSDVSAEEARFLFLRTYLLIGEILSLQNSAASESSEGRP